MKNIEKIYRYIIYFILFVPPLVFFTNLTRNPYYFQIVLLNSVTVLLWMLWLYKGISDKKIGFRLTPLDLPIAAFFVFATLTWILAFLEYSAHPFLRYGVYSEGLKRWLFLAVNSILVYYAGVQFVDDLNRQKFLKVVYWVGFIASLYGIMQYYGMEFIWPNVLNPFGSRSVSTFGNPNFLSSYLVLLFPLLFAEYWKSKTLKSFFYLVMLLVYFGSMLCTLTRSSWLGTFVALALTIAGIWVFERSEFASKKNLLFVVFGLFIVFMLFWPKNPSSWYNPSVIERLTESVKTQQKYYGPWSQRKLIWSCAWNMVKDRPFYGRGWGCFELFYPFYQGKLLFKEEFRDFRTHANNSHNEILEIWSQTGTIGLGIYFWFITLIIVYGINLIKSLRGDKRLLAIALLSSLAGMWADNLLNVSLHFAVPGFLYWWQLGLLMGLSRYGETELNMDKPFKIISAWFLIVLGAAAITKYGMNFIAEIDYFTGFKLSKQNNVNLSIKYLSKAHSLQRFEVNNNYELANAYARAGSRDDAIEAYKEALRANAGYDEIYFNLGTVLLQKGLMEDAIVKYSESLNINPMSYDCYMALGSIFLQDYNRFATAGVSLFKQCLYFFPDKKDVWNNMGFLYTKVGDDVNAYESYKKAFQLDPDFEMAVRNLKVTLERLKKRDKDLDEIERLFYLAEKGIVEKNWEAGLSNCEKLVKLIPKSFKARLYMANIYFTVGRVDEAIQQYTQANAIIPDNPAAIGNLGLAYMETKQVQLAYQQFKKLIQIDPGNQLAKEKLSQIEEMLYKSK